MTAIVDRRRHRGEHGTFGGVDRDGRKGGKRHKRLIAERPMDRNGKHVGPAEGVEFIEDMRHAWHGAQVRFAL